MKRFYTCLILLSLFISIYAQTNHAWQRTNPGGGGAFNVVKAGPTGIILAGSDLSGAYMSIDNGLTFTPIGAAQGLGRGHVGGIGFDPVDEKKFFIGTEGALHRTTDGGITFTKVISSGYISDIVVSKSNPLYVYAAWHSSYNTIDGTIYRSTDGGATFSSISGNTSKRILKLISDPKNNLVIYYITGAARSATSMARLCRSADGGVNFTDITGGKGEVMDADIDPVTTSTIYMTTYTSFPGGSFFNSNDNGATWSSPISRTGGIFVKKDDPNRIRIIDPRATASWNEGSGTWESIDGGNIWNKTGIVTDGWETAYNKDIVYSEPYWDIFRSYNGTGFEGEVKGFGTDMSNPDVILWATQQFLFRSTDGGVTFKNIFTNEVSPGWWQSRGIDNVNMTDMAISEANPKIIYAGYFDMGFWRSLDGGISWQSSNDVPYSGWDGYGGNVMSIAADPTRESVVWTTMSENQLGETPTYLLKSTNYGERGYWVLSNSGLPTVEVMGLSINRLSYSTNRTIYVTAKGNVYKSINDGANWTKLINGLPTNGGMRFTAVDNFNGNIVYAGGGNGLYASIDGGANWTQIGNTEINTGGTIEFWPQTNGKGVFDIAPDPQTSGVVYITVYGASKGLYRGVKGIGSSWTWTKLCTDNCMRKVCVNSLDNNYIYATSSSAFTDGNYSPASHGVLFSNDKFQTYTQVNENMAWPFAMTVKIDKENNVYVGSPGTGFQKSPIPGLPQINTFYVSKDGYDSNPGTLSNPFKTINYGVSKLIAGDRLIVRNGVYNEMVSISQSGTEINPITISAFPGENPIIDGDGAVKLPISDDEALMDITGNYIHVSGFEIRNSNFPKRVLGGDGLRFEGGHDNKASFMKISFCGENGILVQADNTTIEDCEFFQNAQNNMDHTYSNAWPNGISFSGKSNSSLSNTGLISRCKVYNNHGNGIDINESSYITIEDCIFYDNWSSNLFISDATNCMVQRNLIYNSPSSTFPKHNDILTGIILTNEISNGTSVPYSSDNTLINNFIYHSQFSAFSSTLIENTGLSNVLIANNTIVDGSILTGALGNINSRIQNNIFIGTNNDIPNNTGITFSNNFWSVDPPINAVGTGDIIGNPFVAQTGSTAPGELSPEFFKLLINSPAINKGLVLSDVTEDFFQNTRGTLPDIGGYEYPINVGIPVLETGCFRLFPNPATTNLNVELNDFNSNVQFQIFDQSGKLIKELNASASKQQINIMDLTQGVYFIRLKGIKNSTMKFIKQ